MSESPDPAGAPARAETNVPAIQASADRAA